MHRFAPGIGILLAAVSGEKDFHISTEHVQPDANFNLKALTTHPEGEDGTLDWKLYYRYEGKGVISPWHDIPFIAGKHPNPGGDSEFLYHFVCEIPKGSTAKMEINKEAKHNPIIQDTENGKPRHYKYNPEVGSLVNYGAITQTWEHPDEKHPDTGVGGDNDPIDVLQLNEKPCKVGEVQVVRVLGIFALVDGGETDWKVLVVNAKDSATESMQDVRDVPAARKSELIEWFRRYKTAEGKGLNTFGLDEKVADKVYAHKILTETHAAWKQLVYRRRNSQEL